MTREEEIKFRDECAIKAMSLLEQDYCGYHKSDEYRANKIANLAFVWADAMLEEKKKRDEKLS